MAEATLQALLEAGAHFGHQTSRWNPNMRRFILTASKGIHLINLQETLNGIAAARALLAEQAGRGRAILFVGTKKQAKESVKEAAETCKHFYVNVRWLGGMLTNFATIRRSLKKVDDIDRQEQDGTFKLLPKKEVNSLKKKREKILNYLGGIRAMTSLPGAVVVVDILKEQTAVREATRLEIPIVGLVDTNSNPAQVGYPIPANDDSLKTIKIILDDLASLVAATPVSVVAPVEKEEKFDGKRRVIRKKIVKKIIKKKSIKVPGAPGLAAPAADAAPGETVLQS